MSGVLHAILSAGGWILSISNVTVADTGAGTDAGYRLNSDGDIRAINSGGNTDIGDWITPKGESIQGIFSARATLNSGSLDIGTTGSWLALTTSREWSTGAGNTANLTIELSPDGGTTVSDSATIDLDATGA